MWVLYENYATNQRENLGQYWDHESRLLDAVLWLHHKSKMVEYKNRYVGISQWKSIDCDEIWDTNSGPWLSKV